MKIICKECGGRMKAEIFDKFQTYYKCCNCGSDKIDYDRSVF